MPSNILGLYLRAALLVLDVLGIPTARADAPLVLLSGGCGSGNNSNNVPQLSVDNHGILCIGNGGTAITGNATGTTGAVVGTLAAAAGKTTYICGFNVSAVGSAAGAVGPVTIGGLVGSSQVYQATAQTTGNVVAQAQFTPCIPASAVNTPISITTTPDATATAVDINSWGFQQ